MKKIILLHVFVLTMLFSYSQKSFQKGDILLNPGVGFGSLGFDERDDNLALFFSVDFGVHDYVSVGPYAGFKFLNNSRLGMAFGGRGNFHFWHLIADNVDAKLAADQFEMYLTLFLGYNFINTNDGYSDFGYGTTLGLRWYPNANNRFALFGEFGRTPVAYSTIGCTIKL